MTRVEDAKIKRNAMIKFELKIVFNIDRFNTKLNSKNHHD